MTKPLAQRVWSLITPRGTLRVGPGDRKALRDAKVEAHRQKQEFMARQQALADSYRKRPKPTGRA